MANGKLKYRVIEEKLLARFKKNEFQPNERLPTEAELAKEYSANHLTVRKALKNLEDQGVISREQGRGTFFIGGDTKKSVLYAGSTSEHIFGEMLLQLQGHLPRIGCRLSTLTSATNGDHYQGDSYLFDVQLLKDYLRDTDVIIIHDHIFHQVAKELTNYKNQIIVVGDFEVTTDLPCTQILFDRPRAVKVAVNYLYKQGYRKISLAIDRGKELFYQDGKLVQKPKDGFRLYYPTYISSMHNCGIGDWEQVIGYSSYSSKGSNLDELTFYKKFLQSNEMPEAIITDMDYRAKMYYASVAEMNIKIPRDLAFVGIGDTPWATALHPALTSVNLGIEEMVDLIGKFCAEPPISPKMTVRIQPRIVPRESTIHFTG